MSEQITAELTGAKKAITDVLRNRLNKARFMTELVAGLRRSNFDKVEVEQALAELEVQGVVIIRDHFCADPHLANVDLRVVALVESVDDTDAQISAFREIDNEWNKWLEEYLTNHRCG